MDLKVIAITGKDGRGHVVLADQAHDPATARLVTLEVPVEAHEDVPYAEREAAIAEAASVVLREAGAKLRQL
jgi:hypothetical protein